jgi:hypothetical protein
VSVEGSELEHVHSFVVKVGDERAQFDVDEMLENLSSIVQVELVDLLQTKYIPWMTSDVKLENLYLNQIMIMLTRYLTRSARSATTVLRMALPTDRRIICHSIRKRSAGKQ